MGNHKLKFGKDETHYKLLFYQGKGGREISFFVQTVVEMGDGSQNSEKKPEKGREAAAPSNIKEIQEIQGGKKHHLMVTQSTPKMPKWHHSALKACSILS